MVARLTPDQKAACSNHVGVKYKVFERKKQLYFYNLEVIKIPRELKHRLSLGLDVLVSKAKCSVKFKQYKTWKFPQLST